MHTLELPGTSRTARPIDFATTRPLPTHGQRVQVHVVGAAFYEDQLARLCCGRKRHGQDLRLPARLVLHAPEVGDAAAWVEIDGRMVGTLRMHDVPWLGQVLEECRRVRALTCTAVIHGLHAWEHGRRAQYGVVLELPVDPALS